MGSAWRDSTRQFDYAACLDRAALSNSVCLEKNRMQFIQQVQSFFDET